MSSSHAYSAPRETLIRDSVPQLDLEWGSAKRNLPLNKRFVVPGRILIILYTVNNKQGVLIRISE